MPVVPLSNLTQFAAVNLLSDPGHIAGPVVIPNCARVRLNWTLNDGKTAHNVLYASWTGTPALTPAVAESIRAGVVAGTNWSTLAAFIHPGNALASVTLLDVRTATGTDITSTGASTPGTSVGTALPDEVAICITLKTANRGPSGRGRFYVPGLANNSVGSNGIVQAALVTALTTWADVNVRGFITSNLGPMAIGLPARNGYTSDKTGRVFPARAAVAVLVTQALCRNNTFDSQRRRGLK